MTPIHGEADIKPDIKGTLKPEHKWPKAKSQKPKAKSQMAKVEQLMHETQSNGQRMQTTVLRSQYFKKPPLGPDTPYGLLNF